VYQWLVVVVITYSCQPLIVCEGSSSYLPKNASTLVVKLFIDKIFQVLLFDSLFIHFVNFKVASKETLKLILKTKLLSQFEYVYLISCCCFIMFEHE